MTYRTLWCHSQRHKHCKDLLVAIRTSCEQCKAKTLFSRIPSLRLHSAPDSALIAASILTVHRPALYFFSLQSVITDQV
jgi:hypothetical protein